jgi:hypothetical protein
MLLHVPLPCSQAMPRSTQARDMSSLEPIWQRVLQRSFLKFASPALESGYQKCVTNGVAAYWLAFAPMFTMGWVQVFYRTAASIYTSRRFELPPGLIASIVFFLIPSVWLYGLILLRSNFYKKHWRGIHFAWMCVHVFSTYPFQEVCLWQHTCIAKGTCGTFGGSKQSWSQVFAVENFYLTTIWLRVIVFSAGQASDFFFTTLSLFLTMSGNTALCTFPVREWVSMSPGVLSVAQRGSSWLLTMLAPGASSGRGMHASELSCPAVLAFWQVVGWWMACLLIIFREILSRRVYLKSSVASLGPGVAARAVWWPTGSAELLHKLICVFGAVCLGAVLFWAAALQAFS